MKLITRIKAKISELRSNEKAEGGVVGYYMSILIGTIVAMAVVLPTVITQSDALIADGMSLNGTTSDTIIGLFPLMLALGLLLLFMRPLM